MDHQTNLLNIIERQPPSQVCGLKARCSVTLIPEIVLVTSPGCERTQRSIVYCRIIFSLSNTDNSGAVGQSLKDSQNHWVVRMKLLVNSGLGPLSETKIMSSESEHQLQPRFPSAEVEVIT